MFHVSHDLRLRVMSVEYFMFKITAKTFMLTRQYTASRIYTEPTSGQTILFKK